MHRLLTAILISLILSSATIPLSSCLIQRPSPVFQSFLQLYGYISSVVKQEEATTVIIGGDNFYCGDIMNRFARKLSPNPITIVNVQNLKAVASLLNKPKYIFIFADSVDEIEKRLNYSDTYTSLNVNALIQFAVCYPVKNRLWLESTLKLIWENNILNFILAYYYESLEVVTYDPFIDQIINLTNYHDKRSVRRNIFDNRLHNMHGYQLRVSFFADPPRTVEENGVFYGIDYMVLEGFIETLNATLKIVAPESNNIGDKYFNHYLDILAGRADFGFMSCFAQTEAPQDIAKSYPRRMDDVVVIVPYATALPQFYYVFMMFTETLWLFIVISFVTIVLCKFIIIKYYRKRCVHLSSLLLDVWGTMLGVPVAPIHGFAKIKVIFLLWAYSCSILDALFQSLLTSNLITPKFQRNMETLTELAENNINIIISNFSSQAIKGQYPSRLVVKASENKIMQELASGDASGAYGIPMSVAEFITTLKRSSDGQPVYHMIREHLIPSYSVYLFPHNSPYLNEVDR